MLHLGTADKMSSLCEICLHRDEQMEYSRGGASIVPVCMYNHAHFNLVRRYDQCRDFHNMYQQGADDADSDISEQYNGPTRDRDDCPCSITQD